MTASASLLTALSASFVVLLAVLWLLLFAYPLGLGVIAWARRRRSAVAGVPETADLPPLTVIICTLDEEKHIASKLDDLERLDYPRDRLSVMVVDGGSADRTVELVERRIAAGEALRLVRLSGRPGKAAQLNQAIAAAADELVVVTDADTRLEPSCLRLLVGALLADPRTGIVGARVLPATPLLEERLYWRFLTALWWLEGEALSAAGVSAVCFAARRELLAALPTDVGCDDMHCALRLGARGYRVRLCRAAVAWEQRAPRRLDELLAFRRRRGGLYLRELQRMRLREAPASWRVARGVRLLQFQVLPWALVAGLVVFLALVATERRDAALSAAAVFGASLLPMAAAAGWRHRGERGWWRLPMAAGRLAAAVWFALLTLDPKATAPPTISEDA